MIRNEYRRAFIMLRAAMPGYGGHVRLERRTLTGSMYFIVTAPQGVNELSAALVGQQNGEYYAAPIGALSRDRRGQLALAWQFDPRGIDGRPLEAYAWVAVAAIGGPCAVALTGNVEGSRAVDPVALANAVCALFSPEGIPAADLPDPEAAAAPARDDSAYVREQARFVPEQTLSGENAGREAASSGEGMRGDVRIYTSTRARLREAARRRAQAAASPISEDKEGASAPADPTPEADAQPAGEEQAAPVTAARQLGLDITTPWPEAAEPLRRLFATQAPARVLLGDGYTYVTTPVPEGSGYSEVLTGLRAENGRITGIRYALGGRRAPEPPVGLEGYAFVSILGDEGYWVLDTAVPG